MRVPFSLGDPDAEYPPTSVGEGEVAKECVSIERS